MLHLEDSDADSAVVRRYLEGQGFGGHIVRVHNRPGFLDQLTHAFDVVLADHSMPGFDSCEALRLVRQHCPDVPFIIVSGTITEDVAVEAIKSGAADYVWKDRLQRLGPAIENAVRERRDRVEHETELLRSQESLSRNQARLKAIFEGSLDAMFLAGDDARFVDANPAAAALLGYSREEILRLRVPDIWSPELRPGFDERWEALRAQGSRAGEFTYQRKDGTGVEVEQRATFNVLPGLHLSILRDITGRKAAEAALAEAARRNAEILESIGDGFFALDAAWRMTYVNAEAERYLQRRREDLLGQFIWDVLPWVHGTVFQSEFERSRRDNVTVRFTEIGPVSGTWNDVRAFPYEDGITVYFRDVTEEKRAETVLRESEERLRLVARATNDAVWDWDVRTGAAVMNAAFTEVFGWTAPADGGFTIEWMLEHVHPDDRARVTESAFGAFKESGQGWEAEYRFERADGTWADVVTRGHIVRSADGWAVRVVGTMLDLTARKSTERALVAAKEAAEEIARAKSSLLMNMSHEIRTPLTAVIGYAEMLAMEAPPDLQDLVEPIERGGRRLLDTLNSVLDLAQIEAGALPLATVAVDLRAEAEAAITALHPLAQAKGLSLTF
ncbi:MAG TPA: PAS domain S-box protein, partial [Rubricoccaceae bacterium]